MSRWKHVLLGWNFTLLALCYRLPPASQPTDASIDIAPISSNEIQLSSLSPISSPLKVASSPEFVRSSPSTSVYVESSQAVIPVTLMTPENLCVVSPLPSVPKTVSLPLVVSDLNSLEPNKNDILADEAEVLSLWEQAYLALSMFGSVVVPFFLLFVVYFYVQSKISGRDSIASVGAVFCIFGALILGSYLMVTVPFILVSRFLTLLVSDSNVSYEEQRATNLNARFLLFFTLLATVVVIFTSL
jgi:hypothetical protein